MVQGQGLLEQVRCLLRGSGQRLRAGSQQALKFIGINPDFIQIQAVGQIKAGDELGRGSGLITGTCRAFDDDLPVFGLKSIVSHEIARSSYSRRPHTSQTQAGKFGTVISSSLNQVK